MRNHSYTTEQDSAVIVNTFKHSGDLGDVIFALPTVRALGGGVLYLDPDGGESEPLVAWADKTRTSMDETRIRSIQPLIEGQPYIQEVRLWKGERVDYNLDLWRSHACNQNIADSHLFAFRLLLSERDRPWLAVENPIVDPAHPIVISRSVRVQSNYSFWVDQLPKIKDRVMFVGLAKEHEIFEYTFGHKVLYRPTEDIMTLARVIAGAQQFIGNQSLPHAIAEGLKKNLICEYYRVSPMTIFQRPGAQYV